MTVGCVQFVKGKTRKRNTFNLKITNINISESICQVKYQADTGSEHESAEQNSRSSTAVVYSNQAIIL